jgi:hypothetical protein
MNNPTAATLTPVTIFHADHGLQQEHIDIVEHEARHARAAGESFFIKVLELPEGVADLASALYGPSVGDAPITDDEVAYEKRGDRPGPSRLIDRPHRPCRKMVIIGLASEEDIKIFTAYGTQADTVAPREWWDSGMKPHEAIEAATFWSTHALAR